jgi:hypothetical protein
MVPIKKYIATQFIGKKLHFICDCLIPIDSVGIIKDFEISNNEIIFIVDVSGKLIKIGENHPNLKVEEI